MVFSTFWIYKNVNSPHSIRNSYVKTSDIKDVRSTVLFPAKLLMVKCVRIHSRVSNRLKKIKTTSVLRTQLTAAQAAKYYTEFCVVKTVFFCQKTSELIR